MSWTDQVFFERLLKAVPDLQPLYVEHLNDNGELLAYVALGEITLQILDALRRSIRMMHDEVDPLDLFRKLATFLESAWNEGGERVRDIIYQSFIEFVEGLVIADTDLHNLVVPLMGPMLTAQFGR